MYHIAAIYRQAGLPAETYRAVNATAVGELIEQRPAPASGASCTAARSASTATSSIRRPTKTRRSSRATSIRRPSSKAKSVAREAGGAFGHRGHDRPAERHLRSGRSAAAEAVSRSTFAAFRHLGSGEIYYHLTYIDDLVEGFRLCGEHPAAAESHLHPRRRGSDDAERAGRR